jgi:mannose-1-phosphate guanylyltransferase/mannose-6-phosphate isomerase
MYSIILCGGAGTRLWPLSRKNFPKQFLNLLSDKSLLQETFLRLRKITPSENIILVTNQENFFNVFNQVKEVEKDFNKSQILTEPESLNTLPAITCAIKYLVEVKRADLNSPIIVSPSDSYIKEPDIYPPPFRTPHPFAEGLQNGIYGAGSNTQPQRRGVYLNLLESAAASIGDNIGTIGIIPAKPETGYGYIKKGERNGSYFKIEKFVEKPDKETALEYISSGQYVWNSGVYIFKIKTFVGELKKYAPEIYSLLVQPLNIFIEKFSELPKVSIDVGIAEKSARMVVFEGDFGWSDIGSFDSLAEIAGNDLKTKHINIDSKNIFIHSANNRLVATLGVEDLIVVENNDCILVQKKGRSEDIRKIVEYLNENNYKEAEHNLIVHRPWGRYEILIEEPGYKVKKIMVYPGARLSLQSHFHRVEHWVVVRGTAKIINGEEEIFLRENESTFIPAMARHRLENTGKINLEIIEVQTGHYIKEDDIIRYDDVYGRD